MKSKLNYLKKLAQQNAARVSILGMLAPLALGTAHAAEGDLDVSTVVTYIMSGLAAIALIGVAKMTIAAAPAAYVALMGFIKR